MYVRVCVCVCGGACEDVWCVCDRVCDVCLYMRLINID